jgi:hypothetical protein
LVVGGNAGTLSVTVAIGGKIRARLRVQARCEKKVRGESVGRKKVLCSELAYGRYQALFLATDAMESSGRQIDGGIYKLYMSPPPMTICRRHDRKHDVRR